MIKQIELEEGDEICLTGKDVRGCVFLLWVDGVLRIKDGGMDLAYEGDVKFTEDDPIPPRRPDAGPIKGGCSTLQLVEEREHSPTPPPDKDHLRTCNDIYCDGCK